MYIVCRPLPTGKGILPAGTKVNADGWRNLERLISQRYLRALPPRGREVKDATE